MTVNFTLATKTKVDAFKDSASIGDVVKYEFDCTPWQDDNSVITSATWTNDGSGSAAISAQSLVAGVVSALVNFSQAGLTNIKITLTTATQTKTLWLQVRVVDRSREYAGDDYQYGS